jgi:probable F420-dependent oxidoreductase
MALGEYGVWTSFRSIPVEQAAEAAQLVESLGYAAFWLGGSPLLPSVTPLLEASSTITVATGIVNVWANEPAELAASYQALDAEHPGRLLVGIGIGHPEATAEYAAPLATMRAFLDGLDAAPAPLPRERRAVSALAPRMLALAAERSRGTHTYFVPVEHTRQARERLGAGPLIAAELACVLDEDAERARATARRYAEMYLARSNYTNNLRALGYGDDDIGGGGSDRLIDAVIPHGSAQQIAAVARAHREAGADHVCLQPVGVSGIPREEWTALAAALNVR